MTGHRIHRNTQHRLLNLEGHVLEKLNIMLLSSLGEGGKTYNEITKWLNDLGYKTSDSALSRYRIKLVDAKSQCLEKTDKEIVKDMENRVHGLITEIINVFEKQKLFLAESISKMKEFQKDTDSRKQ